MSLWLTVLLVPIAALIGTGFIRGVDRGQYIVATINFAAALVLVGVMAYVRLRRRTS